MFIILFLGSISAQMQGAYAGSNNFVPPTNADENGVPQTPIPIFGFESGEFFSFDLDAEITLNPDAGPWVKHFIPARVDPTTGEIVPSQIPIDSNPANDPNDQTNFSVFENLRIGGSIPWADWHQTITDAVGTTDFIWADGSLSPADIILFVNGFTCGPPECIVSFSPDFKTIWVDFDPPLIPGVDTFAIQKTLVYTGFPTNLDFVEVSQFPTPGCTDDSQCDDGLFCNGADICNLNTGLCERGTPVDCSALDDQCNLGTCDPSDGSCFQSPDNEGNSCDDNDRCNVGETCQTGSCTGGAAPDCSGAGNQCNDASCDPTRAEGNCDTITGLTGNACDDGNACTTGETCLLGTCDLTSTPTDCSALADQCNAALCDSATGCFSEPVSDGIPCDDSNSGTIDDECTGGVCAGTSDLCR